MAKDFADRKDYADKGDVYASGKRIEVKHIKHDFQYEAWPFETAAICARATDSSSSTASRSVASRACATPSAALLRAVRPHVTLFSSSGYINDLANGSLCVSLGWSGDINIARQRAIDNKTGHDIVALVPRTGGLLFFDVMVIPADAPRPGNAHKFINYILRPEVHASLTNKVFYANPNIESKKFVKPEVASNPTVFLPPDDLARMVPPDTLNNDLRRLMTRTFTSFKTGL